MRFMCSIALVFLLISGWASRSWAQSVAPASGQKALIPDISLIGSLAGAVFRDDPVGEQGENPARSGFNLQGMELALQSVVDPYVRGDLFLLFKETEVELEEGTLTTLAIPHLQLKGGMLLAKMGRINTRHLEQVDFVDTPFVNRHVFGAEGFRELGLETSGLLPVGWFSELTAQVLQGDNAGNFDGARKGDFAYLGHWKNFFELTDFLSMQTGLSGAAGFNDTAVGKMTQIYGGDLYFRWRPSERRGLKWQTEYFFRRREVAGATATEGGFYSQLLYQFARRWDAGLRYDQIGLPQGTLRQRATSPEITFHATEFFRARGQYNLVQVPGQRDRHEGFLQVQFNMGPHGAHTF